MKILLLNPPFKGRFSRTSRSPAVTKGGTFYYPIWLAYATGAAEQAGHDCRLVDAPASGLSLAQSLEFKDGFVPDIVVVDTSTPSIRSDVQCAQQAKQRFPDAFVLLVGTHPSALPVETLAMSDTVDAVASGEYDHTLVELAQNLADGKSPREVAGLYLRLDGRASLPSKRKKIENLDDLPFVSSVYRRHLNHRHYFFAAANYPMIMIMTGRGCPFQCFFCVYPQTFHSRRYRTRSAENVAEEFAYIRRNFPDVREVGVEDDCFTAKPSHATRICEELVRRDNSLPWYCNVRGDVELELLRLMRRAGCRLVTVGFESGSQQVLDNMRKGERVERYLQFAEDARRAGLLVHGCIMAGCPGDTPETLEESYRLAIRLNCDSMQFYPLFVYPGTEAYEWAKNNNYLQTEDYDLWLTREGLHNCVLSLPGLSAEELVQRCDHYLTRYHLRPQYLLRKGIQAILHPSEGYRSLKSGGTFIAKLCRTLMAKGEDPCRQ